MATVLPPLILAVMNAVNSERVNDSKVQGALEQWQAATVNKRVQISGKGRKPTLSG